MAMRYLPVLIMILLLVIGYGWVEHRAYQRLIEKTRLRILVNGTRGKTSVTRLLAAALNAAGMRCCAKTTGSDARWISPEGIEVDYRHGKPAQMMEQRAFFRFAEGEKADAAVLECMALRPENQRLMAEKLVRQHYTLITNAYVDHVDEMGWTYEETARTLALSIHPESILVTGEKSFSEHKGRRLKVVSDLPPAYLDGFLFPVYAENIALVLTVTDMLGIPRETALTGMRRAKPDIGMYGSFKLEDLRVYNAFSANDPTSFRMALDKRVKQGSYLLLYNHRNDRPQRLRMIIGTLTVTGKWPERIGVMGEDKAQAARLFMRKAPVPVDKVETPEDWIRGLPIRKSKQLLCAGNVKGAARDFLSRLLEEDRANV